MEGLLRLFLDWWILIGIAVTWLPVGYLCAKSMNSFDMAFDEGGLYEYEPIAYKIDFKEVFLGWLVPLGIVISLLFLAGFILIISIRDSLAKAWFRPVRKL